MRTIKLLDMPEGNDVCLLYREMMKHVDNDRSVAVIPVRGGAYLYSARPEGEITEDQARRHVVRMGVRANHAAMCEGYEVLQA